MDVRHISVVPGDSRAPWNQAPQPDKRTAAGNPERRTELGWNVRKPDGTDERSIHWIGQHHAAWDGGWICCVL